LWRPLTAFTHWVDYRLFPHAPAWMHLHNILWYAAAVFLVAVLYRRMATSPRVAALAACLFLLDKDTYLPVLYVANRGFFIALVFGLLCLQAHARWRTTGSGTALALSALCLLLALLANEAGVSTLAFVIAYALVLEPGGWSARVKSLVPAGVVVAGWRLIYWASGFGVRGAVGYIDPGYAPALFLRHLASRANGLLGGQLTGLPPEIDMAFSAEWRAALVVFFATFTAICGAVFVPVLRRDRTARFWAAATLLALVPAATVAPFSKNLGFVAVGAFGVMAAFLSRVLVASERAVMPRALRSASWCVAVWLIVAHVPGALAARAGMALASPSIPQAMATCCSLDGLGEIGERDVVVINDPPAIAVMAPFDRAYRGRPLPRTINALAPGGAALAVTRPDASTLILTAHGDDLFGCPALGPIHACYVCAWINDFLFGAAIPTRGERVIRKSFVVEVLEVSARGVPRSVAFRFARPLEDENTVWAFFDWRRRAHARFALPAVGDTVEIAGA
jgi:hypothetical protein